MPSDGRGALAALFVECVSCQRNCERISRSPERGVPPRGFTLATGSIAEKVLMVIFGEPGSITPRPDGTDSGDHQLERRRYQQALRQGGFPAVADEQAEVTLESFQQGRSAFHRRTAGLLRDIFGSPERALRSTYFSNLTKCEKQHPPPPKKEWGIPSTTRVICADLFLIRELEIIQPKAILAFGNAGPYVHVAAPDRTIALDHPSHRGEGPAWLRNPERERIIGGVRHLIGRV